MAAGTSMLLMGRMRSDQAFIASGLLINDCRFRLWEAVPLLAGQEGNLLPCVGRPDHGSADSGKRQRPRRGRRLGLFFRVTICCPYDIIHYPDWKKFVVKTSTSPNMQLTLA